MYGVMYHKRGSNDAWGFTLNRWTEIKAQQIARQYRKAGYEAIKVMYPS